MRIIRLIVIAVFLPFLAACGQKPDPTMNQPAPMPEPPAGHETATFGGGCYWCLEAAFRQIPGVSSVTSGFMGGKSEHPSYEQVCSGDSGHAEVVQVVFDPKELSYDKLLDWFWRLHDPTTLNRQGADVGTQYRSVIFTHGDAQRTAAEASKKSHASDFDAPIVTAIQPATAFWPAPKYHQDYYFQNKSKNPYCRAVIEPKLKKNGLKH